MIPASCPTFEKFRFQLHTYLDQKNKFKKKILEIFLPLYNVQGKFFYYKFQQIYRKMWIKIF